MKGTRGRKLTSAGEEKTQRSGQKTVQFSCQQGELKATYANAVKGVRPGVEAGRF